VADQCTIIAKHEGTKRRFALASLLILALGSPSAVSAQDTSVEDEIVVIARKFKEMRFVWKANDASGQWRLEKCRITKSSGDKEIDRLSCQALESCLPTMPTGSKEPPASFDACLTTKRRAMIAELARKRAAAK
jgi:hypothetical protein